MPVAVRDIPMPRLSDSMEEGTVLRWLKQTGEDVRRGDELVEIETDKATMTYEAEADGVIEVVAEEGATLPLGATMARIHPLGSRLDEQHELPNTDRSADPLAERVSAPAKQAPPTRSDSVLDDGGNGTGRQAPSRRPAASPVARRIAEKLGVDLSTLTGTGPGSRIVKADVAAAAARGRVKEPRPEHPSEAPAPPSPPVAEDRDAARGPARAEGPGAIGGRGAVEVIELGRAQQLVARRMAEAKATAPDFALTLDVDMSVAVELREELRAMAGDVPLPTYNDMVVRATALALRQLPRANGSYRNGQFELHSRVNVGVAVAARGSLTVPTIFDADKKPLGQIAREARVLSEKVREGTITPPELSNGTFTVSNLGMYGVTAFTAILNSPQAGILAVGAVEHRPVIVDGEIVAQPRMSATLTADHRILYGADAAELLAQVRDHLQEPRALLL